MRESDANCARALLVFFNGILAVLSIIMGAAGLVYIHYAVSTGALLSSVSLVTPLVLTLFSLLLLLLACFGCCGALLPNKPLLMCFGFLVFILFVAQITVSLHTYANSKSSYEMVSRALHSSMTEYDERIIKRPATRVWDFVQITLQCCGSEGAEDWNREIGTIPHSCGTSPYSRIGCFEAMATTVSKFHLILLLSSVGILVVEIVAMLLSCSIVDASTDIITNSVTI